MKTSELITVEACTKIYEDYRINWSRSGLNEFAETIYCENGEDGIVEKVFSEIGEGSKFYVEFGAWDGCHLSNTCKLRKESGWHGLLLDGKFDEPSINLHKHYLTAENIVELFNKYDVPSGFDFLSIDIDGNDYYLLKEIFTSFRPRLIVIETNQLISPSTASVIEYNPNIYFDINARYFGASVKAFDDLAKQHDYVMICQHDQNVFFLEGSEVKKLQTPIDGLGDIEKLFKPRIPRWYLDANNEKVEFSKKHVENLACNNKTPEDLQPIIEKTMKNLDNDGDWIIL